MQGATIELKLIGGPGHVDPGIPDTLVLTTNELGDVSAWVQTGSHPGRLYLQMRVLSNPANPWLKPSRYERIEVQPGGNDDDDLPLRPRLKKGPGVYLTSTALVEGSTRTATNSR